MFKGVFSPVITILDQTGKIDFHGMHEHIDYLINNGIDGLLFLGSMGEFFAFTEEEKKKLITFAIETVNHRVPVLIGTGGTSVEEVVKLTQFTEVQGADAAVVISPYYFKLDDENLYNYYAAVAQSTKLPIVIYNFPERTNVNISPELVLMLVQDFPNIVAIKDTVDNISHTRQLIQGVKSAVKDFSVFSGFDEYLVPNLMAGGDGVLCGLTNVVPELFCKLFKAYQGGDFSTVVTSQQKISELMSIYDASQPFVAAMKTAVMLTGRTMIPMVKAPGTMLDEQGKEKVRSILVKANVV
ncbi:4-hydroxy-tetrahydrodipicolinate synthase [Neobacillus sp. B4I6]|jgi:4-hydroxy-tetrahydrodipicolinate synthase|uniref:4-hydroxy-tetrahydrodipicolinate synthase n=1 Tax=Neobacillus sp. B4I6 TaxID=3373925 RepID=UPI003D21E600